VGLDVDVRLDLGCKDEHMRSKKDVNLLVTGIFRLVTPTPSPTAIRGARWR